MISGSGSHFVSDDVRWLARPGDFFPIAPSGFGSHLACDYGLDIE